MSNIKHLPDILRVCSVLPIFAVMPAIAETVTERQVIKESKTYNNLIADGIVSSIVNNGGVFYMEDAQDTTLTFKGDTVFSNNSLTNLGMGGAIGNGWLSTKNPDKWPSFTPGGKIVFDGKASFSNNTAKDSNGGGALFNFGVGTVENPDIVFNGTADFTGNKALGESPSVYVGGGAVHHHGGAIVFNQDATFTNNTSATKGGAVMASGDVVFKGDAKFAGNTAKTNGGGLAIIGGDVVFEKNASFTGNTAGSGAAIAMTEAGGSVLFKKAAVFENNKGIATLWSVADSASIVFEQGAKFSSNTNVTNGTLQNAGTLELKSGDFTFVGNTGTNGGGIKTSGTVNVNTTGSVLFDSNVTTASAGAIDTSGTTTFIAENISFLDNSSDSGYAGAVFNTGDLYILGKENIFSGNIAKDTKVVKSGGGALHNRGSEGMASLIVGTNDSENVFKNNQSYAHGGAIVARAFDGEQENSDVVINGDTEFVGNSATLNGGAIWNSAVESDGSIGIAKFVINGDVEFKHNTAGDLGGAIFNGGLNATVDMSKAIASFSGNKATVDGGAIYNDANAVLKIGDAKFVNNHASYGSWEKEGYGGAIFANGDLDIVSEKANGVMFKDNVAFSGGAVYGSMNSKIGMNLENVLFVGNHAIADAGALGIFNNDVSKLTDVVFRNNTVAVAVDGLIAEDDIKEADGGGAIQLGGTASADLVKTHFVGNESGVRGGAISARHGAGYELNITDSSFTNNKSATNGGSIANVFAGAVSIENVNFIGNKANERGGAIYNGQDWNFGGTDGGAMSSGDGIVNISGTNVFSGNIAGDLGGAIFNGADGVINMTGINTFVNNTANGGANDIYNDGTLNIAPDTKVVISGGIKGNGTLTLAGDATLDIGTSLVEQDKISIDGTVVASIVSGRSYGRLSSDNLAFGENAVLQLNIGSVGTYDIFGDGKKYDVDILVGDTYIATETDRGIIIETKSVADIAEDAGLTVETAGTVANLANSVDRNLQKLSLLAQQALNSGNSALVEKETAKLAPEDENMTRSVAMSAQSQALSLASGRMTGGMGRAGGDKSQTNGFWAQGLFNKTEYADQFHGYSRGVAVGADTTIDRKYTIGAGLMHTNSDVHSGSRHTDISTTTLFAYGQYKPTDWFLNGTLVYAMSEYDESADPFGVQINSLYNTNSFGAQAMTGYALKYGLTPQVGIRYLHIEQDEYNNGVNRMNAMDYEYLSGVAGFAYSFNINNARSALQLKPELRAMLTYDLVQDNSVATVVMNNINSSYIVDGENLSRMGGEFGVGLTATYNGVDVSVMYDITLHEDYTSQTGMIKFRGRF